VHANLTPFAAVKSTSQWLQLSTAIALAQRLANVFLVKNMKLQNYLTLVIEFVEPLRRVPLTLKKIKPQLRLQTGNVRASTTVWLDIFAIQTTEHVSMMCLVILVDAKENGKVISATARSAKRTRAIQLAGAHRAHRLQIVLTMNGKPQPQQIVLIVVACQLKFALKGSNSNWRHQRQHPTASANSSEILAKLPQTFKKLKRPRQLQIESVALLTIACHHRLMRLMYCSGEAEETHLLTFANMAVSALIIIPLLEPAAIAPTQVDGPVIFAIARLAKLIQAIQLVKDRHATRLPIVQKSSLRQSQPPPLQIGSA
jgi:hypothetical protein